jgi:hypothetical protein
MKVNPIILDSIRLAIEGDERRKMDEAKSRREIADAFDPRVAITRNAVFSIFETKHRNVYNVVTRGRSKNSFEIIFADDEIKRTRDGGLLNVHAPHIFVATALALRSHVASKPERPNDDQARF